MAEIQWRQDWDKALAEAEAADKPIFLDFFMATCIGCQRMGRDTYPDPAVVELVDGRCLPLRLSADALPQSEDYGCRWTPHYLILGADGKAWRAASGWLPPADLISWTLLGMGQLRLQQRRWADALTLCQEAHVRSPDGAFAAEALYWSGVCAARAGQGPRLLKQANQTINQRWPGSQWARMASIYGLPE